MQNPCVNRYSYQMSFLTAVCCAAHLSHERICFSWAGGATLLEGVREPCHTVGAPCADPGGHKEEQEVAELKP